MRNIILLASLLLLPACLEECSGLRSGPVDCAQCAHSCDDLCAPMVGLAQCDESCQCECEYPDAGQTAPDAGEAALDAAFCQYYADAC